MWNNIDILSSDNANDSILNSQFSREIKQLSYNELPIYDDDSSQKKRWNGNEMCLFEYISLVFFSNDINLYVVIYGRDVITTNTHTKFSGLINRLQKKKTFFKVLDTNLEYIYYCRTSFRNEQ